MYQDMVATLPLSEAFAQYIHRMFWL